ncbi:serine protease grass-like [Drosophila albomicans]|uniref:Serine protease grass-like n=1 Tax=Drosophila albomicans TaxID=7291 RepID=A0A6P8X8E1_DROAB|nr:serine protease grass-like [Drosophila albomicans]
MLLRKCSFISNIFVRKKKGTQLSADNIFYIQNSNLEKINKTVFVCCEENEKIDQAIHNLSIEDCGRFAIDKIMGGQEIQLMSRPWLALLYFKTKNGSYAFKCAGTLINKRYVLTAAHCFLDQELLSVRLGEHYISQERDCRGDFCAPPVEDIDIERIFVHEKYSRVTRHNDIALVKLSRDVEVKENITPICLPTNYDLQQEVNNMAKFHVTGWGKNENGPFSDFPKQARLNRIDRLQCQNSYPSREIVSTQICAGGVGYDSCKGDSGGPLSYIKYLNDYQRIVQYGVVSIGKRECGNGSPGVYTNVGSYIRWIAYKIATK